MAMIVNAFQGVHTLERWNPDRNLMSELIRCASSFAPFIDYVFHSFVYRMQKYMKCIYLHTKEKNVISYVV